MEVKIKKIMVVDDEEPIRIMLQDVLSEERYEVDTASNGEEAFAMFQQNNYDLIITDLKMPDMDGQKLFCKIKQSKPATMVIVLTGHASLNSALAALHSGCDDFLLKPLASLELLKHAISSCLKRRNCMLQVASLKRISKTTADIMEISLEELHSRLDEIDECLDSVDKIHEFTTPANLIPYFSDIRDSSTVMRSVLTNIDKVNKALHK